jgi:hypothetical protein
LHNLFGIQSKYLKYCNAILERLSYGLGKVSLLGRVAVSTNSIFISYSSKDRRFVERLATDLRNKGLYVWFDQWELKVGDSLVEKINAGLKSQDYLVVVLSKSSVSSQWVMQELIAGLIKELNEKRTIVLPVLIEDCDIPALLRDKIYADFRHDYHSGLNKLLGAFPGRLFSSGMDMRTRKKLSTNVSTDNISITNVSDAIGVS